MTDHPDANLKFLAFSHVVATMTNKEWKQVLNHAGDGGDPTALVSEEQKLHALMHMSKEVLPHQKWPAATLKPKKRTRVVAVGQDKCQQRVTQLAKILWQGAVPSVD